MSDTRKTGILLFVFFFCVYLLTASIETPFTGDSLHMMADAKHILQSGFVRESETGEPLLSKYGVGQPLLNLPVVPLFRRAEEATHRRARLWWSLPVSLLPALIGAGICVLVYAGALRLELSRHTAVAVAGLCGLTTMVWPYTQTLFADAALGLFWLAAFYALLCFRDTRGWWWAAAAGAAAGYAVLVKVTAAPVALLFAAYLLYLCRRETKRRRFHCGLAFALPMVLVLLVLLWYNHLRFGTIMTSGYGLAGEHMVRGFGRRDSEFGFNTPLFTGLHGLLLSPGKGFLWYNPILVLAIPGMCAFRRRRPAAMWLSLSIFAVTLLIHAKWWAWHGDWSWGPRFLLGAVPFLAISCGYAIDSFFSRTWRRRWQRQAAGLAGAVLIAGSVGVQLLGLAVPYPNHIQIVLHSRVLPRLAYDRDDWPIRNDTVHGHFIPDFSPLAGHWWMIRCTLARDSAGADELRQSPPWAGLNPQWVPKLAEPDRWFHWNVWWAFFWQNREAFAINFGVVIAVLIALLAGAAGAAGGILRQCRKCATVDAAGPPPTELEAQSLENDDDA